MAARLTQIRSLFRSPTILPAGVEAISAYIVPSEDAHASEYIADCDCRREFISGFTGSRGCAYITEDRAALFTDGRYFLQAENELYEGWQLQKIGLDCTPSEQVWLRDAVPPNSKVGVDATLISAPLFRKFNDALQEKGSELVAVETNLVDSVWGSDRPSRPMTKATTLSEEYTGRSVESKISSIRSTIKEKGCSALVVSALDEVAWLFNLRGSDIIYNPVFFAYAVVTDLDIFLYMHPEKIPDLPDGSQWSHELVQIRNYDEFFLHLKEMKLGGKIWVGPNHSLAVALAFGDSELFEETTAICYEKSIKNEIELRNIHEVHLRDSVALAEYYLWLEREIGNGNTSITEVVAADKLEALRAEQKDFVSPSFATISSIGSNGAIIHYHPREGACGILNNSEVYLCDSGGQYKGGTTDCTRTVHFGSPTEHEKKMFTLVLKGHISLTTARFPATATGLHLDSFARRALWDYGEDYQHGTGHGVGSFLNVHEGPHGISARPSAGTHKLRPGMTVTIEPGYYENDNFGIRIENVVEIVSLGNGFNAFNPFTLFPIQAKMIDLGLLTDDEIKWINEYHKKTLASLAPILVDQGRSEALIWLENATRALSR